MVAGKEAKVEKRALPLPIDPEYYSILAGVIGELQARELTNLLRQLRRTVAADSAENGGRPPQDMNRVMQLVNIGVGLALAPPGALQAYAGLEIVKAADKVWVCQGYLPTVLALGASERAIWALQQISALTSNPLAGVIAWYEPLIAWYRGKLSAESRRRLDTSMGLCDFGFNPEKRIYVYQPQRNPDTGS